MSWCQCSLSIYGPQTNGLALTIKIWTLGDGSIREKIIVYPWCDSGNGDTYSILVGDFTRVMLLSLITGFLPFMAHKCPHFGNQDLKLKRWLDIGARYWRQCSFLRRRRAFIYGQRSGWILKKQNHSQIDFKPWRNKNQIYHKKQGGHLTNVISDSEIYHKKKLCLWSIYHPPNASTKL